MQIATLPRLGERIGSGGFGDVYIDPQDSTRCIKKFKDPQVGPAAQRLIDLVVLGQSVRPSDALLLRTRFGWPLEVFGNQQKIVGYRMPRVPDSGVFELTAGGRTTEQLLQAMYVMDPDYWKGKAIQSAAPVLLADDRLLVARDLLRTLLMLHRLGFAFADLSSKNAVIRLSEPAGIFLLDVDSVVRLEDRTTPAIDSPGWFVPRNLEPGQRDWMKAALFVWRLLLEDKAAQPEETQVGHFDRRVGKELGAIVLGLFLDRDDAAGRALLTALDGGLSPLGLDQLVDAAVASRFAREVLELRGLPALERFPGLVEAAESQVEVEERVESATGLRLRLLLRGLRATKSPFDLDVARMLGQPVVPTSIDQFEDLVLKARFDDLVEQFHAGALGAFDGHPWLDRAVAHALTVEPVAELRSATSAGGHDVSFRWASSPLIDRALIRVFEGSRRTDEHLLRREPGRSTIRIQNLGRGRRPGAKVTLQVVFGVSAGDSDRIVYCPADATLRMEVPDDLSPVARTPRLPRRVVRPIDESIIDVAVVDPEALRRRLRRRLVAVAAVTMAAVIGSGLWFWLGDDGPNSVVEAVAVRSGGEVTVTWAQRAAAGQGIPVRAFAVQERLFGFLWWRDLISVRDDVEVGEVARAVLPMGGDGLRVATELLDGRTIVSPRLTIMEPPVGPRGPLAPPDGVSASATDASMLAVVWRPPVVGPARLVAGYQVRAFDLTGVAVFEGSSLRPGITIPAGVVASAPRGLTVAVRARTADGTLTRWSTPVVVRLAGPWLLTPVVRVSAGVDGIERLVWALDDGAGVTAVVPDHVVEVIAPDGSIRRLATTAPELTTDAIRSTEGAVRARVRSIAADGSRSQWSEFVELPALPGQGD